MSKPKQRRQSSRYLSRRIVAAHNVLNDPMSTDAQRHGARCRLNRAVDIDAENNPFRALAA